MKWKILFSVIILVLLTTGVVSAAVINQYKTPRGNAATVESLDIHKERVGLTVNGETVEQPTWYHEGKTYVPLRASAEMLGAKVNYNSDSMSADIVNDNTFLEDLLLGDWNYSWEANDYQNEMTISLEEIVYEDEQVLIKGTQGVINNRLLEDKVEGEIVGTEVKLKLYDESYEFVDYDLIEFNLQDILMDESIRAKRLPSVGMYPNDNTVREEALLPRTEEWYDYFGDDLDDKGIYEIYDLKKVK
ncbi:stalk domain-containing protein [Aquibacillus sediminis]|uniref:stalk domain-containing protein n=1 Tax=Aquibacillus sediminis TaxID=2574734 RepID=UPI0014865EFF|nr:stalk domain-containing protein [Aquibacillus sediminis]